MKTFYVLFLTVFSVLAFAQTDLESDDKDLSQMNAYKDFTEISPAENLEFYKLHCTEPIYAQYPDGIQVFKNIFKDKVLNEVNNGKFSVNGQFSFYFDIDETGKMKNLKILPIVDNTEVLFNDFTTAFKTTNFQWIPAKCDEKVTPSRLRLKVNFTTFTTDL